MQLNDGVNLEEAVTTIEENIMEMVTCNIDETDNAYPAHDDRVGVSDVGGSYFKKSLYVENSNIESGVNGLSGHINEDIGIIDNFEDTFECPKVFDMKSKVFDKPEKNDSTEDESSDDETESEDEFMPDGEPVRKSSRGFRQLVNCKKFWLASQMVAKRRSNFEINIF